MPLLYFYSQSVAKKRKERHGIFYSSVKAGDVMLHNIRLVHGSPRSKGEHLRRTLYYDFQSMHELLRQGGPRPEHPVTDTWIRDRYRLLMRAVDARRSASYAHGEIPYAYQPPAEYGVAWPDAQEEVNLRPALGYNKYI